MAIHPSKGAPGRPGGGKWALVTGASPGIGFEIARRLSLEGLRVVGVGRDEGRCRAAAGRIDAETGGATVAFELADLSRQGEVRSLAERLVAGYPPLDVLIHNAGTFTLRRVLTADGLELQFAVNYLAGFTLAALLLPHLAERARVMMVSSGSHRSGRIHWNNLALRPVYNGLAAYGQSKLAEVMFCYELARRAPRGIDTYAIDPGLVKTEIGFKGTALVGRSVWKLRSRAGVPPAEAAQPIVELALSPGAAGRSGRYWSNGVPIPSSRRSYEREAARRLWELSERLTGISFPEVRP